MKKKIGIITVNYPLGVLSDVTSMAISLEKEGFMVDIFIDQYMYNNAKIDFFNENIKVFPIEVGSKKTGGFWTKRILNFSLGGIYDVLIDKLINFKNLPFQKYSRHIKNPQSLKEKLFYHLKYFFPQEYKFTRFLEKYINEDYVCLIGLEPQGLICATIVSLDKNLPVIYHNLELLLTNECQNKFKKILKKLEKECSQRCLFTIIQDKKRAQYLIEDNNLDPQKIRFLPVSSGEKIYKQRNDYLHRQLNIPKDKNIILLAGNICPATMALELAKAAQKWKDGYVLVLHGWNKLSPRNRYVKELQKIADNKKVYLSTKPVLLQQLPELLSSAKIGLLFYKKLSPNSYEIGSSLNKLVQYLRVGLPVISVDFPSLIDKIEKNNCGICVKYPNLINDAILKIMANYDYYSNNSYKLYEKDYDFSKNFRDILEEIKQLVK